MKILIAAGIFPPDIGGPAIYAKAIAEQFNKQGIKTDVICYSHEKNPSTELGYNFKVFRILRKHSLLVRYFLYFFKILRIGRNYDIIYAQDPVSSGFPASKAAKFLKKKFMVKVTGDYAWEQSRNLKIYTGSIEGFQKLKFQGKIGKLQEIERKVCRAADLVIVPSKYLKKITASWGIKDEKINIIYNAVRKNINDFSDKHKDKNLILSISRLVSWKGLDTLINLMPELLKINPDFKLMIIGNGPEEENLKKLIAKLNLEEKVSISYKAHNQAMNKLNQAGIYVLNTDYEGLPHTILEAMTMNVPVIATKIGGNPEVIEDNYNGFLVEYNNKEQLKEAILELYRNKELQEKFIKNSKKVLLKFDFNKMVKNTLMVLRNL